MNTYPNDNWYAGAGVPTGNPCGYLRWMVSVLSFWFARDDGLISGLSSQQAYISHSGGAMLYAACPILNWVID